MTFATQGGYSPIDAFQRDAERIVTRIRTSFLSVIEAVCGGSPRAYEVADAFGIHRKLAWQIWNVTYDAEPIRAVRYMPTARGIQAWRKSAEKLGTTADLLQQLDDAARLFDELTHTHAPNREMLEMMLGACEPRLDEREEERWRKQAFMGNAYVFGVRAKTYLTTLVLHPSAREGYFDLARVHGLIGLARTRPNVRWPFAQAVVHSGESERFPRRTPILPSDATRRSGVPLMEEFCSQPLPPVARHKGQYGMLEDELLPGPIGQTGESTVITGEVARELASIYKTEPGEDAHFGTGVRTPCEALVYDHLVHHQLFPGVERRLRVYSELICPVSRDERDLLRVSENVQRLGRGTARLRTAEVPRYGELIQRLMEQMGWNPKDFDVYRIRMRYPPLPAAVMLQHDLPDPPNGFAMPDRT
jgi:hypothetical protein